MQSASDVEKPWPKDEVRDLSYTYGPYDEKSTIHLVTARPRTFWSRIASETYSPAKVLSY
jgi:hypothetical protein